MFPSAFHRNWAAILFAVLLPAAGLAEFITATDEDGIHKEMKSIEVRDAPDDSPLVEKTRWLGEAMCRTMAWGNNYTLGNEELAEHGIAGRVIPKKGTYFARSAIDRQMGGSSFLAVDPSQSFIRVFTPGKFEEEYNRLWQDYQESSYRPKKEKVKRVSLLSLYVRDALSQEYPVVIYLVETEEDEVAFYGARSLEMKAGQRILMPPSTTPKPPPTPVAEPVAPPGEDRRQIAAAVAH